MKRQLHHVKHASKLVWAQMLGMLNPYSHQLGVVFFAKPLTCVTDLS